MDVDALLSSEPCCRLEPEVRDFLKTSLKDAGDPAELLTPFLADAELADAPGTAALCRRFVATKAKAAAERGYTSGTMAKLCQADAATEEAPDEAAKAAETSRPKARSAAVRKAEKAALEAQALAPGARLELSAEAEEVCKAFRLLPELRSLDPASVLELSTSFVAYAEERVPEKMPKWHELLQELLEDSGFLEPEDLSSATQKLLLQLVKAGLLRAMKRLSEVGDLVLAFLPEDEDWHCAVVDSIVEGRLRLIFIEYGKPQEVLPEDVRAMEDVADEGEEGEGECEMCQRDLKLTFHHLIPKDKHPTFLGKRLPNGIEGEPTRCFLNTYGVMICRQCHNTVHSIASNEVLALQYNTLPKLLEHPVIQRWLDFAKKRRASSGRSK